MPSIFECMSVWGFAQFPNVRAKVYASVDRKYGVVIVCGGTPEERAEAIPFVTGVLERGGVRGMPVLDQDDKKIDKIQFN